MLCSEFSNPCYTGDPLRDLETASMRYCDPNSPFSCPNNYYCHVGENSQTTVCCPGSAVSYLHVTLLLLLAIWDFIVFRAFTADLHKCLSFAIKEFFSLQKCSFCSWRMNDKVFVEPTRYFLLAPVMRHTCNHSVSIINLELLSNWNKSFKIYKSPMVSWIIINAEFWNIS